MKYLNLILIMLLSFAGFSQIRTIQADKVLKADVTKTNSVTWYYTGVAADTISVNQDTLIYNITLNKATPTNYYIEVVLDTIAGADTTCVINVNGRMFDTESWSLIETTTTSAVTGSVSTVIESMTEAGYLLTFNADSTFTSTPSLKPCYRQVQVEIIISGNDATGTGIELSSLSWYFQEAK